MSAIGRTPNVDKLQLVPLSADPASPHEGDIYYSDGTARTEGPWVYQNGVWAQFSTGAAITIVDSLTLTPQAADPGAPAIGMLFSSDGTSRAAGLWYYNSSSEWTQLTGVKYQEFTHKSRFTVRAASTANVTLASQVENGDSFGGVTLATNDLVLLKNQTTTTENGVYIVQVSGAPVRSTSYDIGSEITYAQIYVSSGTNANNIYWQNNVVSNIAVDAQSWSTSAPVYDFVVPAGVYSIRGKLVGAGGGGGSGGFTQSAGAGGTAGGGGGGAGGEVIDFNLPTTPGETLQVTLGVGGLGGLGRTSSLVGLIGASGTNSYIQRSSANIFQAFAGAYGGGGNLSAAGATAGGDIYIYEGGVLTSASGGGSGGASALFNGGANASGAGAPTPPIAYTQAGGAGNGAAGVGSIGATSKYVPTAPTGGGTSGIAGGGGGGGNSLGAGGNGGAGVVSGSGGVSGGAGTLGGGGGGGGARTGVSGAQSGAGGPGGDGYARIEW